ncbi:glycosyltransferase [Shewanella sp. AS1]|uniref:glycosyltransferase n=1 Tax=Shewanella sp. AS1 TaxID=2907626 RepID=UPI001F1F1C93|nr:glycosyltransferase [Shewanella sp. AS1]MCE9680059.1 glycosyltransferase [Shewanella sp. AS1]
MAITDTVLIISNSFTGGGAEVVADETYKVIKKKYINVKRCSADEFSDCTLIDAKENMFCAIFSIRNMITLLLYLLKIRPSIIHLHNFLPNLSPSILMSIAFYKFFFSVHVLQTIHDFHPVCPNSSLFNDFKGATCTKCVGRKKNTIIFDSCYKGSRLASSFKYIRYSVMRFFLFHRYVIDLFLCPSQFMLDKLSMDGISQKKLLLLKNPMSLPMGLYNLNIDTQLNNAVDRNDILFLGRLSKEKGIDLIISALKSLPGRNLHICGGGDLLESYKEQTILNGVHERVFFHGYVNKTELSVIAKQCSLLVLPSVVFENSPMVIYEGLALNLVPVVSNIGGMKEVIENLGFGFTFAAGDLCDLVLHLELAFNYVHKVNVKIEIESNKFYINYLETDYSSCLESVYEKNYSVNS